MYYKEKGHILPNKRPCITKNLIFPLFVVMLSFKVAVMIAFIAVPKSFIGQQYKSDIIVMNIKCEMDSYVF